MYNFQPTEPKKIKTKWDPKTPMKPGDMTSICREMDQKIRSGHFKLTEVIRRTLEKYIGAQKFKELSNQHKTNGSNDQKRIVLITGQAYRNYVRKERKKAQRKRLTNPCLRCHKENIQMVNLPCDHETYCQTCANFVLDKRKKCIQCKAHVRGIIQIGSDYRMACAACGFVWDGNAQHECDAEEHVLYIPNSTPEIIQRVKNKMDTVLEGYSNYSESSPDDNRYVHMYEISLIDTFFEDLEAEMRSVGLQLHPISVSDFIYDEIYTIQEI